MVKFIQGDVVGVYNSSGTKLVTFKYDAYGNCTVSGDANFAQWCKIRYRGYYFDTETGFYWVQTRYYNPEWCRWISPDTLDYLDPETSHGLNLYTYCGNDPVNFTDPSGHFALISFLIGLGIGAAIGASLGAVSYTIGQAVDYARTGEFNWSWGGFVGSILGGAIGGAITFATAGISGTFVKMVGAFLSGAAMSSSTMIGENVAGDASHSWLDVLVSSIISGCFSMASVGIMKKIKVPSLNAGRGSMSAVSSQMYTKLRRQIIKRVSFKTFAKMFAVEAYNGTAGNIMEWIYSISGAKESILSCL